MYIQNSFWENSVIDNCDIAIVGAGLSGLWTAYELIKRNKHLKISIFERDTLGLGASNRNAGFACFGTIGEIVADSKKSNFQEALHCAHQRKYGLKKIFQLQNTYELDFDWEPTGGYEFLDNKEYNELIPYISEINISFKENIYSPGIDHKWNNKTSGFYGYIKNNLEGGINAAKLVQGLKAVVQSLGVKIFSGINVISSENGKLFAKNNNRDFEIKTNITIIATNAFSKELIPNSPIVPARGQVLLMHNVSIPHGTFHAHEGFYYFRSIGENTLLIGGGRHTDLQTEQSLHFEENKNITEHLIDFAKNKLGITNFNPDMKWQGIMGFSEDKTPIIQQVIPNVWHIHVCNGMGVAMAPTVAEELSRKLVE